MVLSKTDIGYFLTGGGASAEQGTFHYEPYGVFRSSNFDTIPHTASLNVTTMTVACWFRTSKDYTTDEAGYMIAKGEFQDIVDADNFNFMMLVSCDVIPDNRLEFNWETLNGDEHYVFSDVAVNDGLWHLAVGTFDGTNTKVYLDGVLQETANHSGDTPNNNTYPMYLGQYGPGFTTYEGDVDEVRIWNVALTQQEITDLYNDGTVPQTGNMVYENTFGGSGSGENIDPNLSLGGNISTTQIVSGNVHNLFRRVTESEASSGITLYRCIAIKNKNATDTMRSVVFYMVSDTKSPDDQSLYSFANAPKNTSETPIPDEFTTPTGSSINFIAALNRSGGLQLPDLEPGDYVNVWLRITVNPNAQAFPDNVFKIRTEVNSTGGGGGSEPPPDPDTGVTFTMAAIGDMSCSSNFNNNWTRIKNRNTGFVMFNGDDAYSDGSGCWTSAVGTTWRNKSITSFGNHDVDESEDQPETKNGLINFYPILNGLTYAKHTFNNVGIVVMESGENQSVSDSVGSAQYNFVKAALEEFKANASIEWIIVMNHYPLYGPSSDHGNNTGGRDRYDPLFDTNGVDLVFTSHNHNLWHTKLIKHNGTSNPVASGTDPDYSYSRSAANHGKIFIGTGGGGRSHHDIDSTPSYVVWSDDTNYGYVFLEFESSPKRVTIKFYNSSDTLLKSLTLTHL